MGRDKGIMATGRFRFIEPCKLPWSRAGTIHKGNGTFLVFLWSKSFVTFILIFLLKKNSFLYVAKSICYADSPAWRARWKIPGKAMLTISTVLTVNCGLKVGNSFLYFFSFLTKVTFEVSRSTSSHYKVSLFRIPTLKLFQSLQMQTSGLLLHD